MRPGASLAIAAAVPGSPQSAMILPENPDSWAPLRLRLRTGAPLLITTSPALAPEVAAFLKGRPSLRATCSPVSATWLDDKVLGATSRVLLGLPWAPPGVDLGTTPTPTGKYRVARANATPEPVGKGRPVKVRAKVRAKYSDGRYRAAPNGTQFRVQFKRKGTKKYATIATGVTASGRATTSVTATASGRYRIGSK